MQIIDALRWLFVKAHDDVAFAYSAFSGGTILLERYNQDSAFNRQVVIAHDSAWQRNILARQADVTAANSTVANQTAGDELGSIDRCRKTDSLRRQNHRGVDANHFAARVDQWPTRIAGVEGRVCLNHGIHQSTRLRPQ